MNNIRICLKEFIKNLEDIVSYIECIDKQKGVLGEFVKEKDGVEIDKFQKVYQEFIRVFRMPVAYNAVIISIYGCFESFVDKICSSYIEMMEEYITNYEQLPERLREKHIRKSGEFLNNAGRFRNYELKEIDVVSNLYKCMTNELTYELNKELLLSHGGNLKIDRLFELLREMGIENCKEKFLNNIHFVQRITDKYELDEASAKQFIIEKNKEEENKLFEELDELVEQRNKVAHGWVVDSRLSNDKIKNDIITFMRVLGEVTCNIMEGGFVSFLHNCGKLKQFSTPIAVHNNKILCINSKDSHLECGEYIYSIIGERYKMLKIEEIQVNGKSIEKVEGENVNIGICVDSHIKKNWNYYYCVK